MRSNAAFAISQRAAWGGYIISLSFVGLVGTGAASLQVCWRVQCGAAWKTQCWARPLIVCTLSKRWLSGKPQAVCRVWGWGSRWRRGWVTSHIPVNPLNRCPLRVCVYEPRVFRVQAGGPDTGWRDGSPIWGVQAGVEQFLFNDLKR